MNKVFLIGNLTRDPEMRTTQDGVNVCSFSIAVNRRKSQNGNQPDADFFRVTAWRQLGEICAQYLAKGRKVAITGRVSASAYIGNDGAARANLEVQADDVEFLTPKGEAGENTEGNYQPAQAPANTGAQPGNSMPAGSSDFVQVENEDLPF